MHEFKEIAAKIKETGKPQRLTVRGLMNSIGHQRRGKNVNRKLRAILRRNHLETEPGFELVHIDSHVLLKPFDKERSVRVLRRKKRPSTEIPESTGSDEDRDVVLTIGQLVSDERKPVFITRDEPIERAVTLLIQDEIDHLVVSQNKRTADGIITWASIGKARVSNRPDKKVSDCMEHQPRIVRFDHPLFDTVREITQRGIVLVLSEKGKIIGSVTARTIAEQFVVLSEPFLFLEQIENHLRILLRFARLRQDGLRNLVDPRDERRKKRVKSVDELTFGETLRAFEEKEIWEKLGLSLDRKTVGKRLMQINEIRNHVMHFHPDGISDEDRQVLRLTRKMFQEL